MSERVEEIRRRFEDDPSSDNVFDATDIAILLAALAQAERERDKERHLRVQVSEDSQRHLDQFIAARAEADEANGNYVRLAVMVEDLQAAINRLYAAAMLPEAP